MKIKAKKKLLSNDYNLKLTDLPDISFEITDSPGKDILKPFQPSEKKKRKEKKRQYNAWNSEETIYLIVGFKIFGKRWQQIKKKFTKIFATRSRIDLKDKFRLLNETKDRRLFKKAEEVFPKLFSKIRNCCNICIIRN